MADEEARRPTRALPVPAPPVERLEERAEELARRWASELVLARPLGTVARISLQELAGEAPGLCRQVLRALRSEQELGLLLGAEPPERGASYADRPAALAGAREPAAVIESVEALRGVLWEALREELAGAAPDRSREVLQLEVSDRLAHVCAALAAAGAGAELPVASARPARFPERPPGPRAVPEQQAVIVDERGVAAEPADRDGGRAGGAVRETVPAGAERRRSNARARPVPAAERGPGAPPPGRGEIAIRDARGEAGPAAWVDSIGVQLERYARDALPFAVVLLQIAGAGGAEAEVERALGEELRVSGGGTITRERDGRYWLLAPRADRIGAHALASRMERTAFAVAKGAGASPDVSSGIAVCPEDGTQAAALAAHADVGLYAARWESRAPKGR